jgi:hypothetical protein
LNHDQIVSSFVFISNATSVFASSNLSVLLLAFFLFFFHFYHTIVFDSLNFLPHPKEFNHLFGIYPCSDKLSNRHFILLIKGCGINVSITAIGLL